MSKEQIIKSIHSQQNNLSVEDISVAIESLLELLSSSLMQNNRIEIRKFGSFSVHTRKKKATTKESTSTTNAHNLNYSIYFRPARELRESVKHLQQRTN